MFDLSIALRVGDQSKTQLGAPFHIIGLKYFIGMPKRVMMLHRTKFSMIVVVILLWVLASIHFVNPLMAMIWNLKPLGALLKG